LHWPHVRMTKTHGPVRLATCFAVLLAAELCAAGQTATRPQTDAGRDDKTGKGSISGRVILPDGSFVTENKRITLQTVRGVSASIFTDAQGQFQFGDLSAGSYQVVVEGDKNRFETTTQRVEILRGLPTILTIVLKEKSSDPTKPAAAAISTGELDPAVPAKAKKEFDRATNASKEGKPEEAVAYLRKAIAFYPRYLMAHNDLGAQLLELGNLDEAETELRLALEIDPAAFNPMLNLGIVLVKKHELPQAKETLQKAVSIRSQSPAARLYFGIVLLSSSEPDRAEKEFIAAHDLAGAEFAIALFHLGGLYMDRGDRQLAREYFQRYMKEARNPSNLDQVRKLIAVLE
jgi:Tfp pilus assembly protein PilF